MAEAEDTAKEGEDRSTGERVGDLLREWRIVFTRVLEEAETLTREKPGVGLASSFMLGFALGRLFGKR